MNRSYIIATGCYLPPVIKDNKDFAERVFFNEKSISYKESSVSVIEKFKQITGINQRRYAPLHLVASDIAFRAAKEAVNEAKLNVETIDQIIVAHNYGDVVHHSCQSDFVPSLAARVKNLLKIKNPYCTAYDIVAGCPGWLQSLITAHISIKAQASERCLIIGTETLSRVIDPYDRDSMIFADGAGACILESAPSQEKDFGIISTASRSDSLEELGYINFGPSYYPEETGPTKFLKMKGRKVYEYALRYVPAAMKECMDKGGVPIDRLKMIFIHQANEKLDEAIVRDFYKLYGISNIPSCIMPMSIQWLGNSSVATVPTLFDLVRKDKIEGYKLSQGDIILFASVGAGMNINAVCYGMG